MNNFEWYFLLTVLCFTSCTQDYKISYSQVIVDYNLEKNYEQSILDWHILNSIGEYSKSKYLLIYDSLTENRLYVRDSFKNISVLDLNLVSSIDSMKSLFPKNIVDFFEAELMIYESQSHPIQRGDTIVISLFPKDQKFSYISDPIDGLIHTLYYLNGEVIRVGQNDYTEYDFSDSLLRIKEEILIQMVRQRGQENVNKDLWYLTQ